jgi:hypothetical protein
MSTAIKNNLNTGTDGNENWNLHWEQIETVCVRVANFSNPILLSECTSYQVSVTLSYVPSILWPILLWNASKCLKSIVILTNHLQEAVAELGPPGVNHFTLYVPSVEGPAFSEFHITLFQAILALLLFQHRRHHLCGGLCRQRQNRYIKGWTALYVEGEWLVRFRFHAFLTVGYWING